MAGRYCRKHGKQDTDVCGTCGLQTISPLLTQEQFEAEGCGLGTHSACYALGGTKEGMHCMWLTDPATATRLSLVVGRQQVNRDNEGHVLCPLQLLNDQGAPLYEPTQNE